MQELEKILEEIELEKKRASLSPDCSNEHAVIEIILLEKIEKIIRNHMNDGWIPVEERLPEDDIEVLVTYADIDDEQYTDIVITSYGHTYLGGNKLDFKEWRSLFKYFKSNYKVLAWRPLPTPYSPERSDNHDRE